MTSRRRFMRAGRGPAHLLVLGLLTGLLAGPVTVAQPAFAAEDVGYAGPATTGDGSAATGEKPQSKLWWNDGSWWSVLFHTGSQTHRIFRLDLSTQRWVDTGTMVDNRPKTRSDALWDGTRLYVASHWRASSAAAVVPGNPTRLYRFSYDPVTDAYTRDTGFPVLVNGVSAEALTLDKDSTGVLWATWTQGTSVYVNNTSGDDMVWGTPFALPVDGADDLYADDISAVVSFTDQIGVMWSNQTDSAMYFAVHANGAPRDTWETTRTAIQGPNSADDHINLKSLQADPSGRVFAAVKTSLDDAGASTSAPLILLLARDPVTGDWDSAPFGRISDCHTRPIVVLDSEHQMLHVFATAPNSGCPYSGVPGTIFMKSSPMDALSFPLGRGTPFIRDGGSPNLNNATSTKQSVTSATGLVVMASNDATQRYWHAYLELAP